MTIHGPKKTMSRPSSCPASPAYASPRTAETIRSPTTAKTPIGPRITAKLIHDVLTTCLAALSGDSPRLVSGAEDTSARAEAVTATRKLAKKYA